MNLLSLMIHPVLPVTAMITSTELLALVLTILFFAPLIFQAATGLKALKGKIKLKFWTVCLISLLVQVLSAASLFSLAIYNGKKYEIREGLGFVFLEFAAIFMIILLLLTMIAQWIVNSRRNKINALL